MVLHITFSLQPSDLWVESSSLKKMLLCNARVRAGTNVGDRPRDLGSIRPSKYPFRPSPRLSSNGAAMPSPTSPRPERPCLAKAARPPASGSYGEGFQEVPAGGTTASQERPTYNNGENAMRRACSHQAALESNVERQMREQFAADRRQGSAGPPGA